LKKVNVIIERHRMIKKVLDVSALFAAAVIIPPALADEREDAYAGVERWSAAFNSGDVEQMVRMYMDDALVLGTLNPGMISKPNDLRAYFKAAAAAKLQVKLGDHSAVALAEDASRSLDFTISQDRRRTANLLLFPHALVSSWSKRTAFGRWLIIIPQCGRNRLNKTRRQRQKATLPDHLRWYRKNRWLRGPASAFVMISEFGDLGRPPARSRMATSSSRRWSTRTSRIVRAIGIRCRAKTLGWMSRIRFALAAAAARVSAKCSTGWRRSSVSFASLLDLAKYLDARVDAARKEMTSLTPSSELRCNTR
jgi:hypothetical protein